MVISYSRGGFSSAERESTQEKSTKKVRILAEAILFIDQPPTSELLMPDLALLEGYQESKILVTAPVASPLSPVVVSTADESTAVAMKSPPANLREVSRAGVQCATTSRHLWTLA